MESVTNKETVRGLKRGSNVKASLLGKTPLIWLCVVVLLAPIPILPMWMDGRQKWGWVGYVMP